MHFSAHPVPQPRPPWGALFGGELVHGANVFSLRKSVKRKVQFEIKKQGYSKGY